MRQLILLGADVNKVDGRGRTAAALCVCVRHTSGSSSGIPLVRCMLEAGADRWIKDRQGRTVREHAEERGQLEMVHLLDTYWPITPDMAQVLLGMKGPTESPLTRFAAHALFEPKVLSLVKCLLTGEDKGAYRQLLAECS